MTTSRLGFEGPAAEGQALGSPAPTTGLSGGGFLSAQWARHPACLSFEVLQRCPLRQGRIRAEVPRVASVQVGAQYLCPFTGGQPSCEEHREGAASG